MPRAARDGVELALAHSAVRTRWDEIRATAGTHVFARVLGRLVIVDDGVRRKAVPPIREDLRTVRTIAPVGTDWCDCRWCRSVVSTGVDDCVGRLWHAPTYYKSIYRK